MTIARGPAQLYDISSFSIPKAGDGPPTVYRVVLPYDKSIEATCTCPAFFYRKPRDLTQKEGCKHIAEARYQDSLQDEAPPGFVPGVATDVNDLAVLMEQSLQSAMTLGRKMGRMEARRERQG